MVKAQSQETIRLLSDEAADACIADVACMRGLFLDATLGSSEAAADSPATLLKWTGPTRMASFEEDRLADDAKKDVAKTLATVVLLGKTAGLDINTAAPDDVVNLLLLVSDDFARDRDDAFAGLFSTVFAGRPDLYDQLVAERDPACSSRGFVESGTGIGGGLALAEIGAEAGGLERCLSREILQILGLRHPLGDDADSLLNPGSDRITWTSIDFMLLKLLYNPLIKPGMGLEDITSLFPRVYEATFRSSS